MRCLSLLATLAALLLLGGCVMPLVPLTISPVTPLMEGGQQGYDASKRDALQADAAAGDPVAQYKLGDTFCCHGGGPLEKVTVYDNQKATDWYCRAARQDYAPAQLRLARIYSGHPIRGMHLAMRASALIGDTAADNAVALMWASIAARHGDDEAVTLRDRIREQATDKERARAAVLMQDWKTVPCRWAEVFPAAKTAK